MAEETSSFKATLYIEGSTVKNEVRHFVLPKNALTDFLFLEEKLKTVFKSLQSLPFSVTWEDREGDEVLISSDEELKIAINVMKGEVCRLKIEVKSDSGLQDENAEDVSEYLVVQCEEERSEIVHWSRKKTLLLLDSYKKHRGQVGGCKIRNLKKMFEVIAEELSATTREKILAAHCENRWKVLERNYKKWMDNTKTNGRGRKEFEFSNEMSEILGLKKSIAPEIVLSTMTVDHLDLSAMKKERIGTEPPQASEIPANLKKAIPIRPAKFNVLGNMRGNFNNKYLEMKSKKLEELKRSNDIKEKKVEVLRNAKTKKMEELKRSNDIEEKKVEVLSNAVVLLRQLVESLKK